MKHIYLNLKRFDIPPELGGVNRLAPPAKWAEAIVTGTEAGLEKYDPAEVEFVQYFPEAHILAAAAAKKGPARIGCQGVYRADTAVGGNFGAFTTNRPTDTAAVNRLLNQEVLAAQAAGLSVLYCIGEKSEEQDRWQEVLGEQLEIGLKGADKSRVVIAYEPVWSIGPGKTPADKPYIQKVAKFVREVTGGLDVVYGGGLKADNAQMLASIPEIAGGLIALTRFTGEIGFYPEEYLEIIRLYLGK